MSLRMVDSMPSAVDDCTQRRMKISTASASPRTSASAPSRNRPPGSRFAIGPSTTCRMTRGTAMLAPVAASATISSQPSCPAYGWTYRRSRHRLCRRCGDVPARNVGSRSLSAGTPERYR